MLSETKGSYDSNIVAAGGLQSQLDALTASYHAAAMMPRMYMCSKVVSTHSCSGLLRRASRQSMSKWRKGYRSHNRNQHCWKTRMRFWSVSKVVRLTRRRRLESDAAEAAGLLTEVDGLNNWLSELEANDPTITITANTEAVAAAIEAMRHDMCKQSHCGRHRCRWPRPICPSPDSAPIEPVEAPVAGSPATGAFVVSSG